ncbi:MAG TPA: phosphoribosyltransferase family protein [Thermoanaerobaculia bacterium]|nr:phosphoribosyltransferase family protein [Thermoanaerobaculia bacterium]
MRQSKPKQPKVKRAYTTKQIAKRIAALGEAIRKDAGQGEVFLLGILKGASCFLTDLLRAIPGDVAYGYIDVIRDIADTDTATALEIDFVSHTEVAGRNVFVLKDVVSTGVIENYLLTQLRQHNPAALHLVALLDRPDLRTVALECDYRLFKVGDGSFVGYGLEQTGRFANLPYIATIK